MDNKYELLKGINDDNCRFIINVLDSYEKNRIQLKNKIENTSINTSDFNNKTVIDLDKIWCAPYFYTNMRLKLTKIVNLFNDASFDEIQKRPKTFCKSLTNIKIKKEYTKPSDCTDIVDFINSLNISTNIDFAFISKEITEENIFKEEQIKKAIEVIKIQDRKEQISYIYDEICKYLNSDFIQNNYCDFKNGKCVAQRHFNFYPINRKNGCCFMEIRKCNNLNYDGTCKVECMACRLFSCPYLSKKGIGYWANQFVLFKAFFTKEQRKHLVFDFYKPKEYVIGKILELEK